MTKLIILALAFGLAVCAGAASVASPPGGSARSNFVYVDGEVQTPSRCTWTNGLTLFQALQMAGGFTDHAKVSAVTIRHDNGLMERVKCSRGGSGKWSDIK